jgi:hypothetical protein
MLSIRQHAMSPSWGRGWLVLFAAAAMFVFAAGCTASQLASVPPPDSPPSHSLVFIIHGDGQYAYLDGSGQSVQADEVTAEEARRIARLNPTAEVLIFHERPLEKRLLFFSRPDGSLELYRDGRLVHEESFRRSGDDRLSAVAQRVERFASDAPIRMLLYFGHEIPEPRFEGYDMSYPLRRFGLADFTRAVSRMTEGPGPFDLAVLATCHGGTPGTLQALAPHARHVLASPDRMHLSYLDLSALNDLSTTFPTAESTHRFAERIASDSFERLTASVHTVVSLSVYDVEAVKPHLAGVSSAAPSMPRYGAPAIEHFDCADGGGLAIDSLAAGVSVYYRPARFGRGQFSSEHSGWMCWRERVD